MNIFPFITHINTTSQLNLKFKQPFRSFTIVNALNSCENRTVCIQSMNSLPFISIINSHVNIRCFITDSLWDMDCMFRGHALMSGLARILLGPHLVSWIYLKRKKLDRCLVLTLRALSCTNLSFGYKPWTYYCLRNCD